MKEGDKETEAVMEKNRGAWEPGYRLAFNRRRFLGFRRRFSESGRRF